MVQGVLKDWKTAKISDKDRALWKFLDKVNRQSWTTRREDVEEAKAAGWSDEALYDAITVNGLFKFYNTWIDATGVQDMPPAAYEMSGKRMAENGYSK